MSYTSANEIFVFICLGIILAVPFLFRTWLRSFPVRTLQSVDRASGYLSLLLFAALFLGGFAFQQTSRNAGIILLFASVFSFYFLYHYRAHYLFRQHSLKPPERLTPLDQRIRLGKLILCGLFFATVILITRLPYLAPFFMVIYPFLLPCLIRLQFPCEPMAASPLRSKIEALFKTARVNLKEIYLIDSNRKTSDAMMAHSTLFVTVDLFQKLNEDEIKAVAAHEASHLQHKHLWKRLFSYTAYFMLAVYWVMFPATLAFMHSFGAILFTIPVVAVIQFSLMRKSLRRQEMEADLGAISLGASSEALISALHKLSVKKQITEQHAWFSFHPSTAMREATIRSGTIPKNAYFRYKKYAYAYSLLVLGYSFHVAQQTEAARNRSPANNAHLAESKLIRNAQ